MTDKPINERVASLETGYDFIKEQLTSVNDKIDNLNTYMRNDLIQSLNLEREKQNHTKSNFIRLIGIIAAISMSSITLVATFIH